MFTQFRPDYFVLFSMKQRPEFFPTLGGQIIYFIYKNCQTPLFPPPPAESIGCPQNKPGNKRTKLWNGWCQNMDKISRIFGIFFLVDFLFSSPTTPKCFHRNGFVRYILILIYTLCTCDTLVPTRILDSEISWFCFDFPKWSPVSFIITDFNVCFQFSNKLIKSEWNSLQLIIFKVKHTWNNFFARQEMQEI